MSELNLTPFGFTPTENAVYGALIELGPSGGYPLSNSLGIARANIYQALKGLVAKNAAILVQEKPAEYRAISPDALYAKIVNSQSLLLNELEKQIATSTGPAEPSITPIQSSRSFTQMVLRDAARADGRVRFLGSGAALQELAPAWRKRMADGVSTDLWSIGDWDGLSGLEMVGKLDEQKIDALFGTDVALYQSGAISMVFNFGGAPPRGYWTDETLFSTLVSAAIEAALTS
jgi:sugar-specific transcriptional regulator TrmB